MTVLINFVDCAVGKNLDRVKANIEQGANVNQRDFSKNTPLIWSARCGYLDFVEVLLQAGANPHLKNNHGESALSYASDRGHFEIIKLLLQFGANINERCGSFTPIMNALLGKHLEVVLFLLKKGANLNDLFREDLVPYLLEYIDPLTPYSDQLTPEHLEILKKIRLKSLFSTKTA